MKFEIKIDGEKYFLCKVCGIYKKDKFKGKMKRKSSCFDCDRTFATARHKIKSVVNVHKTTTDHTKTTPL